MEFIKGDPKSAAHMLATGILAELIKGKRVLWLICGGSNVATATLAFNEIKAGAVKGELKKLFITLTDERFGPPGHPDSNWKQLIDEGFDFALAHSVPVLRGGTLEETVATFESDFKDLSEKADVIIAQFGLGADGHIAGMLPHTPAVGASGLTAGYAETKFTRLTLTPSALREIDVAYAFVFGESKREAVMNLKEKNLSLVEQPAQILKEIPQVYFVTDQI